MKSTTYRKAIAFKITRLSIAVVALAMLILPMAGVANAASNDAASKTTVTHIGDKTIIKTPDKTTIEVPMVVKSFTPKNGAAGVQPNNTVYGNCGSAFMSIGNQGGGTARVTLGYHLYYRSVGYSYVSHVNGIPHSDSGPVFLSNDWDGSYGEHTGPGYAYGNASITAAYVVPGGAGSCVSKPLAGGTYITP